ncbi:hypothetical protein BDW75DRAFT_203232 [Aspergillus navahoensis]
MFYSQMRGNWWRRGMGSATLHLYNILSLILLLLLLLARSKERRSRELGSMYMVYLVRSIEFCCNPTLCSLGRVGNRA